MEIEQREWGRARDELIEADRIFFIKNMTYRCLVFGVILLTKGEENED